MSTQPTKIAGAGCLGALPTLLVVLFIILKLTGAIAWSWLWILAPIWVPAAITVVGALLGAIIIATVQGAQRADR